MATTQATQGQDHNQSKSESNGMYLAEPFASFPAIAEMTWLPRPDPGRPKAFVLALNEVDERVKVARARRRRGGLDGSQQIS